MLTARRRLTFSFLTLSFLGITFRLDASSGTQGAAFLDIPVGAGPAAMGSAYTALADNAYASVWNPGALGFVDSVQLAGQQLSYLDSINDEYVGGAIPFAHHTRAFGFFQRNISAPAISPKPIRPEFKQALSTRITVLMHWPMGKK